MCQFCNRDNEVAILRSALANLLEVMNHVSLPEYIKASNDAGIYHASSVAEKALQTINQ